jgi:alanyl aminopeptidase
VPDRDVLLGVAQVAVQLDRRVDTLWLHGRDLEVYAANLVDASGREIRGRWEQVSEDGVAAIHLPEPLGPGRVTLFLGWSAALGRTLRGVYRVDVGDDAYAFTQFEPLSARRAFPCFDEPAFKTPFDVSLVVPREHAAIGSTPIVREEPLRGGRLRQVWFSTTPPLPTYLLAWAVGPLDVVPAPPLPDGGPRSREVPFRGVAARDRGGKLAFALEHTPALVADLERYFDLEYPYPKLDVIAVPDFAAGAMENVGAITFREYLLLLDPDAAPEEQRRGFTYVMAHELAHQWFGNLVTMRWWDDLWLNEAFATWLGRRSVARVHPEQGADVVLLEQVQAAMDADSLVSARSIRQPIASPHDIRNAFDAITYSKGSGVLAMFERWLGEETFREGIRAYVRANAGGSAESRDLLAALSESSGRDVATPFETFLTQPGLPLVEARTRCAVETAGRVASSAPRPVLELRQSRYLPIGSEGDPATLWQVPVCARYRADGEIRESCTLLDAREGRLELEASACPDWVMPNAAAAGYYRFAQPPEDTGQLLAAGLPELLPPERLAVADGLEAALRSGLRPAGEIYPLLPRLTDDPHRAVATAPMELLRLAHERLVDSATRPALERFATELYRPLLERVGWEAAPGEDGETRLMRKAVVEFLALLARDPDVRREAARRARLFAGLDAPADPRALEPELVETAFAVAVQEGGAPVFDALLEQILASGDALERGQRLAALGEVDDPALAERARQLALDPRLRVNESFTTLWRLSNRATTRPATWRFVEENFDALVERVGTERASSIPWLAGGLCDATAAERVEAFLAPRIEVLEGGPRNLAGALEQIRLCAALVEAQSASARAFFAGLDS